jgi:hypothetical protein
MPPAAIAAGVTGAAALGGAVIQSRSADRAMDAQTKASDQAISFEREREEARRAERARAMAQYQAQWDAWNAERQRMIRRYGGGTTLGSIGRRPTQRAPLAGPTIPRGPTLGTLGRRY